MPALGPPLRFAVLCRDARLERWQLRAVRQLLDVPNVSLAAVLVQGSQTAKPVRRMERRANRAWLYRAVWGKARPTGQRYRERLPAQFHAAPMYSIDGDDLPAADLQALELDFILVFFNDPATRKLIGFAKFGVWAFTFGRWPQVRSNLAAFWEVFRREPVTSAVLLRLTADENTASVLREGHLRTKPTFDSNREHLLSRIPHFAAQVAAGIQRGDTAALDAPPTISRAVLRDFPTNLQMLSGPIRSASFVIRTSFTKLLRRDIWNVGVCEQPVAEFLDPAIPRAKVRWLQKKTNAEFVADPFGVMRDGKLVILCEHLDYASGRGTIIVATEPKLGQFAQTTIGPQPVVHLSYPCLFEYSNRIYCVPETHQAREVALYEMGESPNDWRRTATLLSDCDVSDPTVFEHQGRWWLAGADIGLSAPSADLFLWYADSPTSQWTAHPGNPVKTDVTSARPAGRPFVVDGVLYRPSQDCSKRYGGSVTINRVLELTPTSFREEVATVVEPDKNSPFPDGLHTICGVGDVTLIDSKRTIFAMVEVWDNLIRKLKGGMSPV